jgi:hypothetical protein
MGVDTFAFSRNEMKVCLGCEIFGFTQLVKQLAFRSKHDLA